MSGPWYISCKPCLVKEPHFRETYLKIVRRKFHISLVTIVQVAGQVYRYPLFHVCVHHSRHTRVCELPNDLLLGDKPRQICIWTAVIAIVRVFLLPQRDVTSKVRWSDPCTQGNYFPQGNVIRAKGL